MNDLQDSDPQAPSEDQPVHVQVDPAFQALVDESWLRQAAMASLDMAGRPDCELSLYVTGDEQIRRYNRDFRGVDAATDVLSFGGDVPDFVDGPESGAYVGDVMISFGRAQAQALAGGHAVAAELALLVVHGVLHLLGYDHENDGDRRQMWDLQARVLRGLGLSIILPDVPDSD